MQKIEYIRSFSYPGNKFKFLDKIIPIINSFDNSTFVDGFAGSSVVGLNLFNGQQDLFNNSKKFEKIIINEYNSNIVAVYNAIKNSNFEMLQSILEDYNLKNKNDYYRFREYANTLDKNSIKWGLHLFFLIQSCINNMARFNKQNNFNQGWGERFLNITESQFKNFQNFFKSVEIANEDFFKNNITDSMVFLDPSYIEGNMMNSYGIGNLNQIQKLCDDLKDRNNNVILTFDKVLNGFNNVIELREMRSIAPSSNKSLTRIEYLMW